MDTSPTSAASDATNGLGRRSLLKKAAVGGAVAWATPVVLSSPAFADCGSAVGGVTATNFLVHAFFTQNGNDRLQLRPYIDPACTSGAGFCASPQLPALYRFEILSSTPAVSGIDVFQGDTQTASATTAFAGALFGAAPVAPVSRTSPNLVANISVAPSGFPTVNTVVVFRMDVEFSCASGSVDQRCSSRTFEVRINAPGGEKTVTHPKGVGSNSPKGFATSCCAPSPNAITPAWC